MSCLKSPKNSTNIRIYVKKIISHDYEAHILKNKENSDFLSTEVLIVELPSKKRGEKYCPVLT